MKHFFILTAAILLLGCGAKHELASEDDATGPSKTNITQVEVAPVEERKFYHTVQGRGSLRARKWVELSFLTSGKIDQLAVGNAAMVRKGQLVAMLENDRQQIALAEAKVALNNALSLYENEIVALGDSTRYANWPRVVEKAALKAGLPNAKVAVARAEMELSQTYLYAPFDGTLAGLVHQQGNMINASATLATLLDVSGFTAWLEVLEFDVAKLKKGDPVVLQPLAMATSVTAHINEIDPRVDNRGYMVVKCSVPYQQGLYDGMSVMGELQVAVGSRVIVPKTAIVNKGDRKVVFTVENNSAKWNYVKTAEENGKEIAITEGLRAGQLAVTGNNLQLAHDSPVATSNIATTTEPSPANQ